jgi:hypothetical protein
MQKPFSPAGTMLALALLLSAATVAFARPSSPFGEPEGRGARLQTRTCASPEPTASEMDAVATALRRYIDEGRASATGQIKVAWHVIYNGSTGNIPQSQIDAQITYMNQRYAGTGFTFVLASVDRTNSRSWFTMTPGSSKETNAKNALAIDPLHRFNVYTAAPGQGLLGWATFPWSYAESSKLHGVVIHYGSVPGGYLAPFNLGGTLAHECGHYLGLYHTFQGGCVSPGDQIDDTPYEASPASGCPNGRDTCTQPGLDPIHNYMDYTDDACYTQFTAMQITRMQTMTGQYRPNLLNAAIAQQSAHPATEEVRITGGLAFRNVFPNPFNARTTLRLYMPRDAHVSVKAYNVAGALVQTVVDADLTAGEHTFDFAPRNLAAGTYFLNAVSGSERAARAVVLVR